MAKEEAYKYEYKEECPPYDEDLLSNSNESTNEIILLLKKFIKHLSALLISWLNPKNRLSHALRRSRSKSTPDHQLRMFKDGP